MSAFASGAKGAALTLLNVTAVVGEDLPILGQIIKVGEIVTKSIQDADKGDVLIVKLKADFGRGERNNIYYQEKVFTFPLLTKFLARRSITNHRTLQRGLRLRRHACKARDAETDLPHHVRAC